ncbi:MAG: 3-hydroxyacyl-CoA dehydrogenase NAD-binding domain-containing protein, partial [Alphaproteobacteria bacterium]|nr:3-hydroxyacyl-CoA dehydrogenase NAD-binding domain-containing protein [Alphaproteobacteria bacterium]
MTAGVRVQIDDGIAIIRADAVSSAGTFNSHTIAAFSDAIETVVEDKLICGAIVRESGGLDLEWLMAATSPERADRELSDTIALLNASLQRMESSDKPFVAAIDGLALGVGFEIALACRRRIAARRAEAQFGLTDAKLGLPPAAGGALRLARLIGGPRTQALLLAAQPMTPAQLLKLGVIDEVVEPLDLIRAAKRCVLQALPPRPYKCWEPLPEIKAPVNQHAPRVIHETLTEGISSSFDARLDAAARRFVKVARCSARGMVRTLGISVARANSLARRPAGYDKRNLRKVGVLGAGLMGGGIALVCARAGLDVALLDVGQEAAERGLERLRGQEDAAVAADRADADTVHATLARITPTGSYAELCDADIVIEAVFEDRKVKADATRRAEAE